MFSLTSIARSSIRHSRYITLLYSLPLLFISLHVIASPLDRQQSLMPARQTTLVIGKVSNNPKKHYQYLKPIADYAVKHMQDLGIQEAKVVMAKNNQQMIRYLKQGKVDWVTETPFSSATFMEQADAEPILRKWKKGVPEYHTIFITHKSNGIDTLDDLVGKTIAFEDPGSTSAFYLPASVLIEQGHSLVRLDSVRDTPIPDKISYIFSNSEINTSTWVHKKMVAAGAYSNLDWDKKDHLPLAYKKDLKIIYKTTPLPRAIELVRKDLSPLIKQRLKEVLLHAHEDPNAQKALRAYQKTKKFDAVTDSIVQQLKEISHIVKKVDDNLH